MAAGDRTASRLQKRVHANHKPASSEKRTRMQKRLVAELHIEGEGLRGQFPEKRPAVRYRGAWYEDWNTEQNPSPPASRRVHERSSIVPQSAHATLWNGQKSRNAREIPGPDRNRRKRRSERKAVSPDEEFLEETKEQLRASTAARNSIRRHDIERILPFLDNMSIPAPERVRAHAAGDDPPNPEEPDLYVLDMAQARHLFDSSDEIQTPVFVAKGAHPLFHPAPDHRRRPIEQIFEHFLNPTETEVTVDTSRRFGSGNDLRDVQISALRHRFLHPAASAPLYPWNLPDIPSPFLAPGVPAFVQSPTCSVLPNLVRSLLAADPAAVCPDTCPRARHAALRCGKHRLSGAELVHLQSGWLHWQGTVMLAEAGALTHAHWDKWGFGTWVGCYEGAIGFAWLSRPTTAAQRTRWMTDPDAVEGRWRFVVLRPGDALYLPPGTVHLVFRRPEGGQTLALAGHVVRRPDVVAWLQTLKLEVAGELENPDGGVPYDQVVPCLLAGINALIDEDSLSSHEIEKFGGMEKLEKARLLVEEISEQILEL